LHFQFSVAPWLIRLLAVGLAAMPAAAQTSAPPDLGETLQRVGRRVEYWYSRAQTVVSRESVAIQPLRLDLTPSDLPRRLTFELRVAWVPERTDSGVPQATVLRELLTVNGRRGQEDDNTGCMDPKPVSPEPLAMLLPRRLGESEFSQAGAATVEGRRALMIDYRGIAEQPPDIRWAGDCVTVSLPGRSRGRVWVDADTYDVLRVDDRIVGTFTFDVPREFRRRGAASTMTIERAETSIRYRRVDFTDPAESMMLPASIDTLTVMRGSGVQRVRISQRFTEHHRFITNSRLLY
jgi:hypothetical protein